MMPGTMVTPNSAREPMTPAQKANFRYFGSSGLSSVAAEYISLKGPRKNPRFAPMAMTKPPEAAPPKGIPMRVV